MISELKTSSEIAVGKSARAESNPPKTTTRLAPPPIPPLSKSVGNDLGTLSGNSAAPPTRPPLPAVVTRFFAQLEVAADISEIRAAAEKIKGEQTIQNAHNAISIDAKARELSDNYAKDPTAANANALRHARTLTAQDHDLVQQHSRLRIKATMLEISPACKLVCAKAGALLSEAALEMWRSEAEDQQSWGLEPSGRALFAGLTALAREIGNEALGQVPYDGLPAVVEELLRQHDQK